MEKKNTNKKNLKIIGIAVVVLIVLGIFVIWEGKKKSETIPEETGVLPLEEIAKQEGRDPASFVPKTTEVLPLEEINKGDKNFEQRQEPLVPEPTNVPPLEE